MEVSNSISTVKGFKVAGVHAGLKADGALDFALIVSDTPCVAAGVFTTNQVKAAPVLVDMEKLKKNPNGIRAVAVNTKCANACTGQQGIDNANEMARLVAERLGLSEDEVLVMSTGVIGTQLPMEKIKRGVALAADALGDDWDATARAIMTTDTRPKLASQSHGGVNVTGIAKGAGMIAPNMATMLGILATDAKLNLSQADDLLRHAVDLSFNRIVVDGDMSTNDTVLLLSNGAANVSGDTDSYCVETGKVLDYVSEKLAFSIVRDGEGATKFVTVRVIGAPNNFQNEHGRNAAFQIANTIATSPLVKTAFYGNDANWGRIVAAAGRSGINVDPNKMTLWLVSGYLTEDWFDRRLLIFSNGQPTNYSEAEATAIVSEPNFSIVLGCGMGDTEATIYTCDITHDYVSINGHYRS